MADSYSYSGWTITIVRMKGRRWRAYARKRERKISVGPKKTRLSARWAIEGRIDGEDYAKMNPTTAQWWMIGGGAVVVGVGAYFLFRSPPAAASTPVAASAPTPGELQSMTMPAPTPLPQDTLLTPQQAAEAAGAAMVAAEAAANSSLPIRHVSSTPLGHGINPTATVRVGDRFQVDPPYPASAGAAWAYSADATYLNDSGGGLYQAIKPGQVTISANLMQADGSSLDGRYVIVTITP